MEALSQIMGVITGVALGVITLAVLILILCSIIMYRKMQTFKENSEATASSIEGDTISNTTIESITSEDFNEDSYHRYNISYGSPFNGRNEMITEDRQITPTMQSTRF